MFFVDYVCMGVRMGVCIYACMDVCMGICLRAWMYVCMYVSIWLKQKILEQSSKNDAISHISLMLRFFWLFSYTSLPFYFYRKTVYSQVVNSK